MFALQKRQITFFEVTDHPQQSINAELFDFLQLFVAVESA